MLNFGASKPRVKGGHGPPGPPGSATEFDIPHILFTSYQVAIDDTICGRISLESLNSKATNDLNTTKYKVFCGLLPLTANKFYISSICKRLIELNFTMCTVKCRCFSFSHVSI